jgi:hypothetical protein
LAAGRAEHVAHRRALLEIAVQHDYSQNRPPSALGMMTPIAFATGCRTYLEAVSEHLSRLGGTEPWLTETTINSHQLSQQVDR